MEEVKINELEKALTEYVPARKDWSDREKAILVKYYNVLLESKKLREKYLPGRTYDSITSKYGRMKQSGELDE